MTLSGEEGPEVLRAARVSANFLEVVGVRPILGRSFLAAEDAPGVPAVAMISAELWNRRFAAAPSVAGRTVTIDATSYTIVGVLPPGCGCMHECNLCTKSSTQRGRTSVALTHCDRRARRLRSEHNAYSINPKLGISIPHQV